MSYADASLPDVAYVRYDMIFHGYRYYPARKSQIVVEGVEQTLYISSILCLGGEMLESAYQNKLIKKLARMYPDSFIIKNDSGYIQGVPDLLILVGRRWAMLEVKTSATAAERPNQRHYVDTLNSMSFAAFVYPDNEEEVLDALQQLFASER